MYKRILLIVLSLSLVLSLAACGEKDNETTKEDDTKIENVEKEEVNEPVEDDNENSQENVTESNIRENGNLPAKFSEFTAEEKMHYNTIIFDAIKNLDIEVIKQYTEAKSEDAVDALIAISEDVEYKEAYDKVMSDFMYLPNDNVIIGKSVSYMFNMWLKDMEAKGEKLPESSADISHADAKAILDKHYDGLAYIKGEIDEDDAYVIDGKLYYEINTLFRNLGLAELEEMAPPKYSYSSDGYSRIILGTEDSLSLGYEHIKNQCPDYEKILTGNIDDIIEIIDRSETAKNSADFYYGYFEKAYKNEKYKPLIQDWINENVEFVRSFSYDIMYIKTPVGYFFEYKDLTDEEMESIKDKTFVAATIVSDLENKFGNAFAGYYEVLMTMNYLGLIDINEIMK